MRSGGKSLQPLVWSGDTCFSHPIIPGVNHKVRAGDIVVCHGLPKWHYYVHLVWYVEKTNVNGVMKDTFHIGNNKEGPERRYNGFTYRECLYGILTKTERGEFFAERLEKIPPKKHQYNS